MCYFSKEPCYVLVFQAEEGEEDEEEEMSRNIPSDT